MPDSVKIILKFTAFLLSLFLFWGSSPENKDPRITDLQERIDSLKCQVRYDSALTLAQTLFDLKKELNVPLHEIENTKNLISVLKYTAELPDSAQRELAAAECLFSTFEQRYKEFQNALVRRDSLGMVEFIKNFDNLIKPMVKYYGDRFIETAKCWFFGGGFRIKFSFQPGNNAKAPSFLLLENDCEDCFRESLRIARGLLDKNNPFLANCLKGMGMSLYKKKTKSEEAVKYLKEALRIERHVWGSSYHKNASLLSTIGRIQMELGEFLEAEAFLQEALAILRINFGSRNEETIRALNTLGMIRANQGDYRQAEDLFREALETRCDIKSDPRAVAQSLTLLGAAMNFRDNNDSGNVLLLEAFSIFDSLTTECRGNMQLSYSKFEDCMKWFKQGVQIVEYLVAGAINKKDYVLADSFCELALEGYSKIENDTSSVIARNLATRGYIGWLRKDSLAAMINLQEALKIKRNISSEYNRELLMMMSGMGTLYYYYNEYERAESLLTLASSRYEVARTRTDLEITRSSFIQSPYHVLAATKMKLSKPHEAWQAVERDQGRFLADLLFYANTSSLLTREKAIEDSLRSLIGHLEETLDIYENFKKNDSSREMTQKINASKAQIAAAEAELLRTVNSNSLGRKDFASQPYTLRRIQKWLDPNKAIVGWLEHSENSKRSDFWTYVIRDTGSVSWFYHDDLASSIAESSDNSAALSLREAIINHRSSKIVLERNARLMWEERFAPAQDALKDIENLIIIPSGDLLGMPVEAFQSGSGEYVGDVYKVSYIPSSTIYAWLCKEYRNSHVTQEGSSLLVGDPPFCRAHLASTDREELPVGIARSRRRTVDQQTVRGALAGNKEVLSGLYRLPGTRDEVNSIAALCPDPFILLGGEASEQQLVHMVESGMLEQFDVIHISTHAFIDDERPERSALILSQVDLPDRFEAALQSERIYDGLITAKEIFREWKLNADLVTLSACETGLGKKVGGEGYIGFSHAFLQAGARSLLVSLWRVEDRATSLFMRRFYKNYYGRHKNEELDSKPQIMTKAEALQEAKQWLRNYENQNGDKPYQHPFYWSGFVLVGLPD